jgi:hypothetical protein
MLLRCLYMKGDHIAPGTTDRVPDQFVDDLSEVSVLPVAQYPAPVVHANGEIDLGGIPDLFQ